MSPAYRLTRYRGKFAITWIGDDGQRYRRSTGTDDRDAAQQILEEFIRGSRQRATRQPYRVEELWDKYRSTLGTRPAAATMVHEWKALKDRFGRLRGDDLVDVDPKTHLTIAEILSAEHVVERRKAGRQDGTILTELSRLRTVCNWAAERGMLKGVPKWAMPPMPRPRSRHLSRDQFAKFLKSAVVPHLRLFAILAIATGGRMSAILDLTWDRIDFERGQILLDNPDRDRTAKGRAIVPMNASARAALLEAKEAALSDYVIEWAGQKVGSVKKGIRAIGKAAKVGVVSPHDFRHSAAVWMAEDGVSMSEIARYLGHKDSRITERVYARFSPEHLLAASKSLEVGEFTQKRHAKRSPGMSGTGIEKALELAKILLSNSPEATFAQLDEVSDRFVIQLKNGVAIAIPPAVMQSASGLMSGQVAEVAVIGTGRRLKLQPQGVELSLLDLLAKAIGTPAEAERRAS